MKKKVLYIEDEPHLARIVKDTLQLKGYEVLHRPDGSNIREHMSSFMPDICVLDVMLPDVDGFTLGNRLHNTDPALPIIFLTAKTQTDDILKGFSSGGSDYLKKPFSIEELIVRIENQLKIRQATSRTLADEVVLNSYTFYPNKYELRTPEGVVKLSNREAQILGQLCMHANQPVDRRELLKLVWGDDSFFNSRNLDVYIRKIRNYFAEGSGVEIVTLKGKGYHFAVS